RCNRAGSRNVSQRKAAPRVEGAGQWNNDHRRLCPSSHSHRADDSGVAGALADQVVIAAIFKSEAIPEAERLDLKRVVGEIQKRGKQARIFADADAIVNAIVPELRERDVVAILSNGGFGGIYE